MCFVGFPDGCENCQVTDLWECENNCMWYDNYWKYFEVRKFIDVYKKIDAGCNVYNMKILSWSDWGKIHIVKMFIESIK